MVKYKIVVIVCRVSDFIFKFRNKLLMVYNGVVNVNDFIVCVNGCILKGLCLIKILLIEKYNMLNFINRKFRQLLLVSIMFWLKLIIKLYNFNNIVIQWLIENGGFFKK